MGWNEGIKLGLSAYESSLTRQQQALENKRADERFAMEQERFGLDKARTARENEWQDVERGRKRIEYADQDKLNAGIDAYREKALKDLNNPWAESSWQAQAGLAPRAAPVYDRKELDFGTPEAPPPYAPTQGLEPAYIKRQREALLDQVRVAGRDRGAIAAIGDADRKLEMSNTAAQINSYVLGATPEQLAELASKVTLDKRNKYEIKVDDKTGMSAVVHGDKNVELSRSDLGKFMAASYRLKQGDASAAADIDAIDTRLTGIVKDSLTTASTLAATANDVQNKVNTNAVAAATQKAQEARFLAQGVHEGSTAAETKRHNEEQERVARANAAKVGRGAPVQLVNEKGEAGLFYLDKTNQKTGMVEMPAGWFFPKTKAPTSVIKGDDGSSIVVNTHTNTPLFRIDPKGKRLPPGADDWAEKGVAESWGKQGVDRQAGQDSDTGVVSFQYFDLQNPGRPGLDSADAVLRRRAEEDKLKAAVQSREPKANGLAPRIYSSVAEPTEQQKAAALSAAFARPEPYEPAAHAQMVRSLDEKYAKDDEREKTRLRIKIARKNPLTPQERLSARGFGLITN